MSKLEKGGGLLPLPADDRDFSLGGVFGTIDIDEVPKEDFDVCPNIEIKDQHNTDFCTAFSVCLASEFQENDKLNPYYQYALTKEISGRPIESWGANLRDACSSAVKVGSVTEEDGLSYPENSRDYIADIRNWPESLKDKAFFYRKKTYFKVDGPYDFFDNIRAALWQFRNESRAVLLGVLWQGGWTRSEGGVIPEKMGTPKYGHAITAVGQKVIEGKVYLKIANSWGTKVGDNGYFYFPREVINRDFELFGAFMFQDVPKDEAQVKSVDLHKEISRLLDIIKTLIKTIYGRIRG